LEPSCSMRTDEQTDMTKLIVAFRNFVNAHENTITACPNTHKVLCEDPPHIRLGSLACFFSLPYMNQSKTTMSWFSSFTGTYFAKLIPSTFYLTNIPLQYSSSPCYILPFKLKYSPQLYALTLPISFLHSEWNIDFSHSTGKVIFMQFNTKYYLKHLTKLLSITTTHDWLFLRLFTVAVSKTLYHKTSMVRPK
jgi:hypothetical protein